MRILSFLSGMSMVLAMTSLEFDWFWRQCNTLTNANKVITSQCVPPSSGKPGKHKRASKKTRIKPDCYCPLPEYQESMLACYKYAQNVSDAPEESIKDSWNYLVRYCKKQAKVKVRSLDEMEAYAAQHPITQTYAQAGKSLEGAFTPNTTAMTPSLTSQYVERHWQYYHSEIFGMITVWYIAGILFVQAVFHWSAYLVPGLIRVLFNNKLGRYVRRHVALPALFNKHRSTPMKVARYFMLCFPPRLQTLFLTGYIFLSIFFICYKYPNSVDTAYWDTVKQARYSYLAYRTGALCMYKMPFVYLFAGRNNILIWITGWQFEVFNHWHRWLARLFTLDVIIHAIAYSVDFALTDSYIPAWNKNYFRWGTVALICMSFLCLNGTKTSRQLAYEFFLYVHIVLAIITCVGTYYHVMTRQGYLNQYAVWAFWAFDRFFRLVKIMFSNPMAKAKINSKNGVLEIKINYSGWWKPKAGTYIFIHFMHPLYFYQSHPFTVVPSDNKGEMKLFAKPLKGVTRALFNRAQANGGECDCRVLVEGPYGVSFAIKHYKEIVLLAGGIGITAIYSHLQHIMKDSKDQIVHIHWAISTNEPLTWFKEQLEVMTRYANVHVTVHLNDSMTAVATDEDKEKEKTITSDTESIDTNLSIRRVSFRPTYNQIMSDHIEHSQGDIVFFVCGPAPMTDAIRASVTNNMFKTKNFVQYFEESFSM